MHNCNMTQYPSDGYGSAIDECTENDNGEFWVQNTEYGTRVNFCPACGEKAPNQFFVRSQNATNT